QPHAHTPDLARSPLRGRGPEDGRAMGELPANLQHGRRDHGGDAAQRAVGRGALTPGRPMPKSRSGGTRLREDESELKRRLSAGASKVNTSKLIKLAARRVRRTCIPTAASAFLSDHRRLAPVAS